MNARSLAYRTLCQVIINKRSLSVVLEEALTHCPPQDKALLQNLCYDTLRHYYRLVAISQGFLKKTLKPKDRDIFVLIVLGLYQILQTQTPDHAAVSETVKLCPRHKVWARGLVNAVLRQALKQQMSLSRQFYQHCSHPTWFVSRLKRAWPQQWQAVLQANDERSPMTLRVNQQQVTRADYLVVLQKAGIDAMPCAYSDVGIMLAQPLDVQALPGFAQGLCAVQDEAAQLCCDLLELAPNLQVLDACSAPGGKAAHMLEQQPTIDLTILDNSDARLQKALAGFQRLQLKIPAYQVADARATETWNTHQQQFDRILLDVPCSATGVIRRHPDIKVLRMSEDLATLSAMQKQMLTKLWDCLKPGGILLYTTCSIMPEENVELLKDFVATTPDAVEKKIRVPWGYEQRIGRQMLPTHKGPDGFFYARLVKTSVSYKNGGL